LPQPQPPDPAPLEARLPSLQGRDVSCAFPVFAGKHQTGCYVAFFIRVVFRGIMRGRFEAIGAAVPAGAGLGWNCPMLEVHPRLVVPTGKYSLRIWCSNRLLHRLFIPSMYWSSRNILHSIQTFAFLLLDLTASTSPPQQRDRSPPRSPRTQPP